MLFCFSMHFHEFSLFHCTRRKKAFYRQQKLMAEFASQQKAFMEKVQDGIADIEVDGK